MRGAACRKKVLERMADLVERWLEKSLVKYTDISFKLKFPRFE